jgi:hypothetical protein
VDGLIEDGRRHNLRLVFLWFGSWKNGMSSYMPVWSRRTTSAFHEYTSRAERRSKFSPP